MANLRLTPEELTDHGYILDPTEPNVAVRASEVVRPAEDWTDEALIQYASSHLNSSDQLEIQRIELGRRQTVHIFRAGQALSILRHRKKVHREWTKFQDANNLNRTTVWRAIELFNRAGDEQAIADLPLSEAYTTYNIPAAPPSDEGRSW